MPRRHFHIGILLMQNFQIPPHDLPNTEIFLSSNTEMLVLLCLSIISASLSLVNNFLKITHFSSHNESFLFWRLWLGHGKNHQVQIVSIIVWIALKVDFKPYLFLIHLTNKRYYENITFLVMNLYNSLFLYKS